WHPLVVSGLHLFADLDRDLREAFDITLLDHGILLMLRNTPDGLTMGHLAAQFGVEASVITYRIGRMQHRELVTRQRHPGDRRLVHAQITDAGQKLCDLMGPVHVASVRSHFFDHIPREDLPALADAFERLYRSQRPTQLDPPT
ncbi:MAG: MarR family winged helix-turn-helix transcriptional regulator, partial [Cellulomonas sp.]